MNLSKRMMLWCALLLYFWLSTAQAQSLLPTFLNYPSGGVYTEGEALTLTCETQGATVVEWRHNGVAIISDTSRTVSGSSLNIDSLSAELAGSYYCLTSNDTYTVISPTAVVQLAVLDVSFHSQDLNSPNTMVIFEGQPMSLNCGSYTSIPTITLDWSIAFGLVTTQIDPSVDFVIQGLDGRLYFQNPKANVNNEIYVCQALNPLTAMAKRGYIDTTVLNAGTEPVIGPVLMAAPQDTTVSVGGTAAFQCIVGGSQAQSIQWSVPPGVNQRQTQNGAVLILRDVTVDHAGSITCHSSGIANITVTLTVIDQPSLSEALDPTTTVTAEYGTELQLSCAVEGAGQVVWSWYHNGNLLVPPMAVEGQLSIASSQEEHSGAYQCFARNLAGVVESSTVVKILTIAPSFVQGGELPPQQLAFTERSFNFSCEATGVPFPTYMWLKDSVPLSDLGSGFQFPTPGVLHINSVDSSHSGIYTCRAVVVTDREVGRVETTSTLTVIAQTVITRELPPTYSIHLDSLDTLSCEALGDSTAELTFYWTKDGVLLEISGNLEYENPGASGSLRINSTGMSDAGVYMCLVNTTVGTLSAPTVLSSPSRVVITVDPIAPEIVSVVALNATAIKVGWFFPGDLTGISSYSVEVRLSSGTEEWRQVLTQQAWVITEVELGGLTAFTSYDVRVVVFNMDGTQVPSKVYRAEQGDGESVVTMEDTPSSAPVDVKVTVISETELFVEWEPPPPQAHNGVIQSYMIQYRLAENANLEFDTVRVPGDQTNHSLTSLQRKVYYEVSIAAYTTAGAGPFSKALIQVTDPNSPQSTEAPLGTPVQRRVWFIPVMCLIGLLLIIAVIVTVAVSIWLYRRQQSKKYHVHNSGVTVSQVESTSLSEDAALHYESRSRTEASPQLAFSSNEYTIEGSNSYARPNSSIRYTPQPSSSSSPVPHMSAPAYINPPPFEEALKHRRLNSSNSTIDKPDLTVSEWSEDGSKSTSTVLKHSEYLQHAGMVYSYDDESDSIEKPSFGYSTASSEGSEEPRHAMTLAERRPLHAPPLHSPKFVPSSSSYYQDDHHVTASPSYTYTRSPAHIVNANSRMCSPEYDRLEAVVTPQLLRVDPSSPQSLASNLSTFV